MTSSVTIDDTTSASPDDVATPSAALAPDGTSDDAAAPRPWRRACLPALGVWSAAAVAHTITAYYTIVIGNRPQQGLTDIVAAYNVWDTVHYLEIAAKGYVHDYSPAFFPLYPLTVRFAEAILPLAPMVAALSVSYACAYLALVFLFRLAEHEFGTRVASRTIWYLAVFPAAFALFAAYNTSMFIMLAVGALYYMRRGNWWVAGTLSALASATRLFGILLALPMVIEYLRQRGLRGIRADVLALTLVPAGLVAYSLYCWTVLGDPLKFIHAQEIWKREYVWPGQSLWDAAAYIFELRTAADGHTPLVEIVEFLSLSVAVVLIALSIVGPWRLRRDQLYLQAYGVMGILLLCSTEVHWGNLLQSAPRYTLEAVPIFMVLARMGANQIVDRLVIAVGLTVQTFLLLMFLNWGFVA